MRRLPLIVLRVGTLAWRTSRPQTAAVVVVQLVSAVMSAFFLVASVAVLQSLFAAGPTAERIWAAAPQLALVVVFLSVRALLETAVDVAEAKLTPMIRAALERDLLTLTAHVRLDVADNPEWHDDVLRASERGLFYARQIVAQVVSLAAAVLGLIATGSVLAILHPALIALLPLSVGPVAVAAVRGARSRFHSFKRYQALQRRVRVFSWLLTDRDSAAELRTDTAQGALPAEHAALTETIAAEDARWVSRRPV